MHIVDLLMNPAFLAIMSLFLAIIWMLRDESDKTRVGLVFALILNLFYGTLVTIFMGREGAAFPWKFDYVLAHLDVSLGIPATSIARVLQSIPHNPLWIFYDAMIPMMIAWYLVTHYRRCPGSIVMAYVAELATGPLLYAIVPACGPVYAFGKQWLSPPALPAEAVRLTGMPNAFPSLHVGTALVIFMFAPGKIWKAVAFLFLAATCLATLSLGEHYVIDLIPGMAFGAFAAGIGTRNYRRAGGFFALALAWSLGVRFASGTLIALPILLRCFAGVTLVLVALGVRAQWSAAAAPETEHGSAA